MPAAQGREQRPEDGRVAVLSIWCTRSQVHDASDGFSASRPTLAEFPKQIALVSLLRAQKI
jgi:hypothetical protein